MASKKNCILGLDVGVNSVKALEITRKGESLSVTGLAHEYVEGPERMVEAIRTAVAVGGFHTKKTAVGFSGRSAVTRMLTVNIGKPDELYGAVLAEAEKYVPYDISEAQIDFHPIDNVSGGTVRVFLAAARKQDIEERLEAIWQSGIDPAIIDLECFALANAFELAGINGGLGSDGEASAIVNIGASKTLVAIGRGEEFMFREIPVAGNLLTDAIARKLEKTPNAAEAMKLSPKEEMDSVREAMFPILVELSNEIKSTIVAFKSQFMIEAKNLLLCGGTSAFTGLNGLLSRQVDLPVQIFSTLGPVSSSQIDQDLWNERGHEFMIAFGLASRARA